MGRGQYFYQPRYAPAKADVKINPNVSISWMLKNPFNTKLEAAPEKGVRPWRVTKSVRGDTVPAAEVKTNENVTNSSLLVNRFGKPEAIGMTKGMTYGQVKKINKGLVPEYMKIQKGVSQMDATILAKMPDTNAKVIVAELIKARLSGKSLDMYSNIPGATAQQNLMAVNAYDDLQLKIDNVMKQGYGSTEQNKRLDELVDQFKQQLERIYGRAALLRAQPTTLTTVLSELSEINRSIQNMGADVGPNIRDIAASVESLNNLVYAVVPPNAIEERKQSDKIRATAMQLAKMLLTTINDLSGNVQQVDVDDALYKILRDTGFTENNSREILAFINQHVIDVIPTIDEAIRAIFDMLIAGYTDTLEQISRVGPLVEAEEEEDEKEDDEKKDPDIEEGGLPPGGGPPPGPPPPGAPPGAGPPPPEAEPPPPGAEPPPPEEKQPQHEVPVPPGAVKLAQELADPVLRILDECGTLDIFKKNFIKYMVRALELPEKTISVMYGDMRMLFESYYDAKEQGANIPRQDLKNDVIHRLIKSLPREIFFLNLPDVPPRAPLAQKAQQELPQKAPPKVLAPLVGQGRQKGKGRQKSAPKSHKKVPWYLA